MQLSKMSVEIVKSHSRPSHNLPIVRRDRSRNRRIIRTKTIAIHRFIHNPNLQTLLLTRHSLHKSPHQLRLLRIPRSSSQFQVLLVTLVLANYRLLSNRLLAGINHLVLTPASTAALLVIMLSCVVNRVAFSVTIAVCTVFLRVSAPTV